MLESGSSHGVDKALIGFYNVKVSNNLTIDTSELRKDEEEIIASSAIMETKNSEPHIFKGGKAMAIHKSFS